MENEIWKSLSSTGFPKYEISNMGRVKSLRTKNHKILSTTPSQSGYIEFNMKNSDGKNKTMRAHKLVAMAFLNHTPDGYDEVVMHINHDKSDNRLENLMLGGQNENTRDYVKKNKTSRFLGVHWSEKNSRWISKIGVGTGKHIVLGFFKSEERARNVYEGARKISDELYPNFELMRENILKYREKYRVHGNITERTNKKGITRYYPRLKGKNLGGYGSREEAQNTIDEKINENA